jgi:protein-S-isoprenylcysteine O-methyltransferase Ste14
MHLFALAVILAYILSILWGYYLRRKVNDFEELDVLEKFEKDVLSLFKGHRMYLAVGISGYLVGLLLLVSTIYLCFVGSYQSTSPGVTVTTLLGAVGALMGVSLSFYVNWYLQSVINPVGLYKRIRYPEFWALAMTWLGTAIVLTNPLIAAIAVAYTGIKAVECVLTDEYRERIFGDGYRKYRQSTRMFLPL